MLKFIAIAVLLILSACASESQKADVQTGEPSSSQTVDREAIRRKILGSIKGIKKCYNALLDLSPNAQGKTVAAFDIESDGTVKNVTWKQFDASMEPAKDCMTKAIASIDFKEVAKPNQVIVVEAYPFVFDNSPVKKKDASK